MGSNVLRPGVSSGMDSILEQTFGVPTKPTIRRDEAITLVKQKIATGAVKCERIEISADAVRRHALVDMSGARVRFPEGKAYDVCYVALIDPESHALWAHPAFWAFVPVDGRGDVILQDTEFPANALCPIAFVEVAT